MKAQKYIRPKKSKKKEPPVDPDAFFTSDVMLLLETREKNYYVTREMLILERGMAYIGTVEQINENPLMCRQIFSEPSGIPGQLLTRWIRLLQELKIRENYHLWHLYSRRYIEEPQTPEVPQTVE